MQLPQLSIGDLTAKFPIIQGGMGIGISLHNLAAAVANAGGIGVISGVQNGFMEADFIKNTNEANLRALKREIRLAREKSPEGILGVNVMVAIQQYKETIQAAIEEGIDLIISGAGLPLDLPSIVKGTKTKIAPIVSSVKACALICKMWDKKDQVAPDIIIVEGPEAGGHLGFKREELETHANVEEIALGVKSILAPYEEKYGKKIPVIVAGGIFDGKDIANVLNQGLDGVQMGTRFVATHECDANIAFKEAYVQAKEEDVKIVQSPVGMPGRAIRNAFIKEVETEKQKVRCLYQCLKPCNPKETPYCISQALINATLGKVEQGLLFCGSKVHKVDKIVSVKELMDELITEAEQYYEGKN